MRKMTFSLLVLPVLVCGVAGLVLALDPVDSMRCGSKLVMVGDTKVEVLSKCGEPTMREQLVRSSSVKKSGKKSGGKGAKVEERSRVDDQWSYNLGPHDFIYTLTFEGTELKGIARGGRGTRR